MPTSRDILLRRQRVCCFVDNGSGWHILADAQNLATELLEILLSNKVGAEFVRRLSGESVSLVRDSTFLFDQC
jgi:hypothetical protein